MMHVGKIIGFFIAVMLVACNASNPGVSAVPTQASSEAMQSTSRECPSQDFTIFLDAFVESIEVQKNFTANPLQSDSIDVDAEPEPKQVTAMVSDLQFPVMPNKHAQVSQGLVISTESTADNEKVVRLAKPDSSYQVSYYFKRDACWSMYRKDDESI